MLEISQRRNADLNKPDTRCADKAGKGCVMRDGFLCRAVIALNNPELLRNLPQLSPVNELAERGLTTPDRIRTCQKMITTADVRDVVVYTHLALPDPESRKKSSSHDPDEVAEVVYREKAFQWEKGFKESFGLSHREFRLGLQIGSRVAVSNENYMDPLSMRQIEDAAWERFKKELPEVGGKSACDLILRDEILKHSVKIDVRRNVPVVEAYVREFLQWWDKKDKRPAYELCSLISCGMLKGRRLDGVVSLAGEAFRHILDKYDNIKGPVSLSAYSMLEDRTRRY